MVKQEWKSLLHNWVLVIVLIAILAIPTIYTTLFLGSMWDPYGKVENLPVAVVNEDKRVTYNDKDLNVGDKLVDNLKDNDSLKFDFVSAAAAKDGLKKGKYYMVITIPSDFSKNAATLMDDKPKKMELEYDTNPGTNYIAMKMSESALEKIKNSVANEVTKTYAQTMFDQITTVGDGMSEAADGSGKILNGLNDLLDGNKTITDNLNVLASSSLTFRDGSEKLSVGLKTYTDGVNTVNSGAKQLASGVDKLASSANGGAKQLANGAAQLESGVTSYAGAVGTVADGAATLNKNSNTLNSGISSVSNGLTTLGAGGNKLLAGMQQMSGQIGKTVPDKESITKLVGGLDAYKKGVSDLAAGVASAQLPDLSETAQAGKNLTSSLTQAGADAKALQTQLGALQNLDLDALGLTAEQKAAINGAIGKTVSSVTPTLKDLATQLGTAAEAGKTINGTVKEAGGLIDSVSALADGVNQLNKQSDAVLGNSKKAISGMYSGLNTVKSTLDDQMIPGMKQLNGGITEANVGVNNKLVPGIKSYTGGVNQVSNGLIEINKNSNALLSGAKSLNSGIGQLSGGLSSGVKQLKDGTDALSSGTSKLVANNNTLLSGAAQLSSGAKQISDGAGKLANGSNTLGDGIVKLSDGSNTLQSSLSDGAKEVKEVSASDDTVEMFANPVEGKETRITTVENNGHAMAAYMMSVALWVGCLAFCLMYPLTESHGRIKSGLSWWISKATVVYPLAILMAIVMVGMLQVFNGFEPIDLGRTLLMASLASVAFMSIMYFFNVWLGKVGSFIMLIFMVVQLAGSAGTYPIELSGSFVEKIHKWLPFSYTVDGFRKTICGSGSLKAEIIVLAALAVIFTVLTLWMFQIRARLEKKGKHSVHEFIEKAGLA